MLRKILLSLVLLVLLAVAGVASYFYLAHPKSRPAPAMQAPKTAAAIERGRYLVEAMTGCPACHSPIDESRPGDFPQADRLFAGRVFPPEGFPGTIVAPNLTPDPDTGIGQWTDGEIVRAIREGVSRDGRPLFPLMNYPGYRDLTDDDVLSIVAFLRTQKPIRNDPGRTQLDFPVSMFIRTAPRPLEGQPPGFPPPGLERGRMMMKVLLCTECHTRQTEQGQPLPGMELAGGNPFVGPWGTVYAANITSHPSAGIGAYSDDDLKRVFREGKNRAGRSLWVMPWSVTQKLNGEDLSSLIAALRQVAANSNLVPAPQLTEVKGGSD